MNTPTWRNLLQGLSFEVEPIDLGMHLFVCLTSQVTSFIDQMNQNMVCRTPECSGTFVPVRAITVKEWVEPSK